MEKDRTQYDKSHGDNNCHNGNHGDSGEYREGSGNHGDTCNHGDASGTYAPHEEYDIPVDTGWAWMVAFGEFLCETYKRYPLLTF